MTDASPTLPERLRQMVSGVFDVDTLTEAADRIEELETKPTPEQTGKAVTLLRTAATMDKPGECFLGDEDTRNTYATVVSRIDELEARERAGRELAQEIQRVFYEQAPSYETDIGPVVAAYGRDILTHLDGGSTNA